MKKYISLLAISFFIFSCQKDTKSSALSITHFSSNNSLLPAGDVNTIFEADNSSLWFGTNGGVVEFYKDVWTIYSKANYFLLSNEINCLSQLGDILLAGTSDDGVNRLWITNVDAVTGASSYDTVWTGIASKNIHCLLVDTNKTQWFGTPNGISIHVGDQTRTGWSRMSVTDGLPDNNISKLRRDISGRLWIGTQKGLAVYLNNLITVFSDNTPIANLKINDIAIDPDGTGWLATNKGLFSLKIGGSSPVWGEMNAFSGKEVTSVLIDSHHTFWIGTSQKLYAYKNEIGVFNSELNELMALKVNEIYETVSIEIWVSTSNGAYKIIYK